jgi:hypothetical protein
VGSVVEQKTNMLDNEEETILRLGNWLLLFEGCEPIPLFYHINISFLEITC